MTTRAFADQRTSLLLFGCAISSPGLVLAKRLRGRSAAGACMVPASTGGA